MSLIPKPLSNPPALTFSACLGKWLCTHQVKNSDPKELYLWELMACLRPSVTRWWEPREGSGRAGENVCSCPLQHNQASTVTAQDERCQHYPLDWVGVIRDLAKPEGRLDHLLNYSWRSSVSSSIWTITRYHSWVAC